MNSAIHSSQFETGDPHPDPALNLLAFVKYDEQGQAIWTSVYRDRETPYRLARENQRRRLSCTVPHRHTPPSQRVSGHR